MKWLLPLLLLFCITSHGQTPFKGNDYMFYYQVNIGKTNGSLTTPSAWLEIGKDSTTKAIRMPRAVDTSNIATPVFGLMIYQMKDNGIYFRDKFGWRKVSDGTEINGTTNILVKFGPTGKTLVNSQLFDNGANVGINNTSPTAKLDIGGTLKTSGPADINNVVSVTGNSSLVNNTSYIQFRKNNGYRVGYLGDAFSYDDKLYLNVLNGNDLRFWGYIGDTTNTPITMTALFSNQGKFVFGDSTVTGTATFRVKGSGQLDSLAIGLATPLERLHINGNIIANAPTYVSGGIVGVGRNQTTGRFESYTLPGAGTVNSVGLSMPSIFNVSGSPVTTSGTLTTTLANQLSNLVLASPNGSSGTPAFRMLTNSDLPISGATSGIFGSDTTSAIMTVNSQGIVTSSSQTQITIPGLPGTPNMVTKYNAIGNRLASSQLFDNGTNVGIGTTSPTEKLQVNGNIITSAPTYSSGGISPIGRNNTTGRLETFTAGSGTVTSVALSLPSIFSVSGSPVTTTGTLTGSLVTQSANLVFSGPTGGGAAVPTFRSLVTADIPLLDASNIGSGTFPIARGGTGLSSIGTANQQLRVNSGGTALEYFTPTTSGSINSSIYTDGTYSLSSTNGYVTVNGTGNNTITLSSPSPTGNAGKIIFIVKMAGFSYILDGTTINARMVILVCNGTTWLSNLFT